MQNFKEQLARYVIIMLVAFVLSPFSALASKHKPSNPTEPAYLYRATVVRVVDGDTVDVDIDLGFYVWLKNQRIRLVGINAPEPRGKTKKSGKRSSKYLKKLIEGKEIIIRTIKSKKDKGDRKDSFRRWLGVLYLNGMDVNQHMIERGYAEVYVKESRNKEK